jgi:hypothetical protein
MGDYPWLALVLVLFAFSLYEASKDIWKKQA